MPLCAKTLYPLTATPVEFSYCYDRPLKSIATRYAPIASSKTVTSLSRVQLTLLFISGISFNQETWVPLIKHIYNLASLNNFPEKVGAAWVVERPNHGDAALLNERELKEHYASACMILPNCHLFPMHPTEIAVLNSLEVPGAQYSACIRAFLDSGVLTNQERQDMIVIGHSGGCGAIMQALEGTTDNLNIRSLVLIESPHCDRSGGGGRWYDLLYEGVTKSNARRPKSWTSKDEAMKWIRTHKPWKAFHPDILTIIEKTYFYPETNNPGRITTKTTVEQETASFIHDGTHVRGLTILRNVLRILPTHLILGSIEDIWPSPMYRLIQRNIEQDRRASASITTIKDVGHYIPVEKPKELAIEIVRILAEYAGSNPAKL